MRLEERKRERPKPENIYTYAGPCSVEFAARVPRARGKCTVVLKTEALFSPTIIFVIKKHIGRQPSGYIFTPRQVYLCTASCVSSAAS